MKIPNDETFILIHIDKFKMWLKDIDKELYEYMTINKSNNMPKNNQVMGEIVTKLNKLYKQKFINFLEKEFPHMLDNREAYDNPFVARSDNR